MGLLGNRLIYFAVVVVVVTCVLHCVSALRICVLLPIFFFGFVIGICAIFQHVNKLYLFKLLLLDFMKERLNAL